MQLQQTCFSVRLPSRSIPTTWRQRPVRTLLCFTLICHFRHLAHGKGLAARQPCPLRQCVAETDDSCLDAAGVWRDEIRSLRVTFVASLWGSRYAGGLPTSKAENDQEVCGCLESSILSRTFFTACLGRVQSCSMAHWAHPPIPPAEMWMYTDKRLFCGLRSGSGYQMSTLEKSTAASRKPKSLTEPTLLHWVL